MFGRKKPKLTKEQALKAKPVRSADAELVETEPGVFKVRAKVKSPRIAGWMIKMPDSATKTFELDPIGKFVWEACDGRNTVQQVIRKLARQFKLNLRETEIATLAFLQTLTRKGLIGLAMENEQGNGGRKKAGAKA